MFNKIKGNPLDARDFKFSNYFFLIKNAVMLDTPQEI